MRNRFPGPQAVADNQVQLAFLADAYGLCLFEWDIVANRVTWSPEGEARLGLTRGTLADFDSWRSRVFPDDADAVLAIIADADARKLDRFAFSYRIRGDDGRVRTIDGTARCVFDAGGTLVKTVGACVDVSDRVEREAVLQDCDAQLRSILETIPDAIVVVDDEGMIRRFSAAAERLFGYDVAAMTGQNVALLVPDSARGELLNRLAEYRDALRNGVSSTRFELVARDSEGREFPVEVSIGVAVVHGERLFTAFVRDLTERAQAEQAAADLRNELAQVSRGAAMGEMATSLAHELNQPLSATSNFLAATMLLVRRGGEREKIAELVALANAQIQRAGGIIRNIREFIVRRDVEIGIEPIEKTIRDAVSLVLVGAARLDIEVRYAFRQPSPYMYADRVQIQQVLVNLLRNAAEALQGQPKHRRTILIAVRGIPEDMIEISVSDTGPGIDAGLLKKLFSPLVSTKGNEGMGLGLSICRRIVEAHGGRLTAENRSAGGATFRLTVPAGSLDLSEEE